MKIYKKFILIFSTFSLLSSAAIPVVTASVTQQPVSEIVLSDEEIQSGLSDYGKKLYLEDQSLGHFQLMGLKKKLLYMR